MILPRRAGWPGAFLRGRSLPHVLTAPLLAVPAAVPVFCVPGSRLPAARPLLFSRLHTPRRPGRLRGVRISRLPGAFFMSLRRTAFAASLLLALSAAHAQTHPLNDTGQTACYDADNAVVTCDAASTGDAAARPRQDARFGRDAQATHGTLTKIGGGVAGFDFTKLCMSGQAAGEGTCPADPAQGTQPDQWACTRDNVTGLVWSLQTFSSISWNDATATGAGSPINDHNTATRCGYDTGWRAPTRRELLSIVHHGASNPAIDLGYFPGTQSSWYWSNDTYAPDLTLAWDVNLDDGGTSAGYKPLTLHVRLVRSGQ
jgi:hypothetical protein